MQITVNAAAKINLFLDILCRFDNGYHSLYMIMQSVGIYDTVRLERIGGGSVSVSCSNAAIPVDADNIASKAAAAFFEAAGLTGEGLNIHIEKRIPFAAGLAGGSADAAAVLAGLDRLFPSAVNTRALNAAALRVGSDVPFCLNGGTMLVQDVGGVLSALPPLPACYFVLAKPARSVSTLEAYRLYDEAAYIRHPDRCGMLNSVVRGDLPALCARAANVFEQCIEVPERVEIKAVMRRHGARLAQMSGSGPTVFGLFDTEADATACAAALKQCPVAEVFVCAPVERGTEVAEG